MNKVKEISETNLISGPYDIIAELNCPNSEFMREVVKWKIRKIDQIRSIVSLVGKNNH